MELEIVLYDELGAEIYRMGTGEIIRLNQTGDISGTLSGFHDIRTITTQPQQSQLPAKVACLFWRISKRDT